MILNVPDDQLGLIVPPARVRLQPSVEDGYAWSVSEGKKHLFETTLGRGTVGLYQNIIDELGKSIEAVSPQILQKKDLTGDHQTKRQVRMQSHHQNVSILTQSIRKQNSTLVPEGSQKSFSVLSYKMKR